MSVNMNRTLSRFLTWKNLPRMVDFTNFVLDDQMLSPASG
jgi:hypothetical protein